MFPKIWFIVATRLLVVVGLALTAGLVFGGPVAWIVGAIGAYLAWHLYNALRLERYLNQRERPAPRDAAGTWGRIYAGMGRLRRGNRMRKKRLTQLLKEFRKSTGAMPDAGVVLNPDLEITWLNKSAVTMLGIRKTDRGQRIDNFLRDPRFVGYLKEQRPGQSVRIASPIDPGRQLQLHLIPYGDNQKLLLGKDTTREDQLQKVRRDFVANASHELRSPLTVIAGYLDSLTADPSLPEPWQAPAAEMVAQAARMRAIIDDLLTLSRLEAADKRAGMGSVDIQGMLALICKDAHAAKLRPATIELELDTGMGICGHESELYSAFSNLMNNAIKHTPVDGRIDMRWREDEEGAVVEVQDTGTGIPEEAIPRLTERFYRVQKGRERSTGGTGLGLAIVKHVLQRHDARLDVVSELGVGSRFSCRFPRDRLIESMDSCCRAGARTDAAGF